MAFIPLGNTVSISTGPTVAVSNVATNANTFRFLNANATAYSYVGVFSNYAAAQAMTSATGSVLAPNWPEVVQGNFGLNPNPGTVYVATISAGSSGQSVIAQPVRSVE
jgi:hypothetical protein